MENTVENNTYRVRLEDDKTPLFQGDIWACERWIRKYGEIGVTYCIVRLKRKEKGHEKTRK